MLVNHDLIVQVRSCAAPRAPHEPDDVTSVNAISRTYVESLQVAVVRDHTVTVRKDEEIPISSGGPRHGHDPVRGSQHPGARGRGNVQSLMKVALAREGIIGLYGDKK